MPSFNQVHVIVDKWLRGRSEKMVGGVPGFGQIWCSGGLKWEAGPIRRYSRVVFFGALGCQVDNLITRCWVGIIGLDRVHLPKYPSVAAHDRGVIIFHLTKRQLQNSNVV